MLNPANTSFETPGNSHLAFLSRAAHDPQFRAALEADPETTLADYGLSADLNDVPSVVALPSPENILDVLIDVEDEDSLDKVTVWAGFLG